MKLFHFPGLCLSKAPAADRKNGLKTDLEKYVVRHLVELGNRA